MTLWWRRESAALKEARRERELSEKRLAESKQLNTHIEKIVRENHFAEALRHTLLEGYKEKE